MANETAVAVLTRAPSSGGKTRIFDALRRPSDPVLLTALLLDTLEGISDCGARLVVVVTPAAACAEVRALLAECSWPHEVMPQPEGTLGERMRKTMEMLLSRGASEVALVGSDLPAITAAPIRAAFATLARDPDGLVLGPAADGGYYLIAARRVPPVFEGIPWSTANVLAATAAAAAAAGVRVHVVNEVADVDSLDDLRAWAVAAPASRTARWARAHGVI